MIKVKKQTVLYEFYEKPGANPKVMERDSAMPHRMMLASMTQEGVRRLANCSRTLPVEAKNDILGKFMVKLQKSGYSQSLRGEILRAAVRTHRKRELAEDLGVRPFHRPGSFGREATRRRKIGAKSEWFRSKGPTWKDQVDAAAANKAKETLSNGAGGEDRHVRTGQDKASNDSRGPKARMEASKGTDPGPAGKTGTKAYNRDRIEAVMFLPHTKGGELARSMQVVEDAFARMHKIGRVKMVERGGRKLKDMLTVKDPWTSGPCGREGCLVCVEGEGQGKDKDKPKPGSCRREGVVYTLSCRGCRSRGVEAVYYGKSSRTAYIRGREHWKGQQARREDNALAKHDELHHEGARETYIMRVVRTHRKPVTRQIHEATLIDTSKAHVILNSKSEYNGAKIPRIRMEVGDRVLTYDYLGQGMPMAEDDNQLAALERREEERVMEWERGRRQRRLAGVAKGGTGGEDRRGVTRARTLAGGEGQDETRATDAAKEPKRPRTGEGPTPRSWSQRTPWTRPATSARPSSPGTPRPPATLAARACRAPATKSSPDKYNPLTRTQARDLTLETTIPKDRGQRDKVEGQGPDPGNDRNPVSQVNKARIKSQPGRKNPQPGLEEKKTNHVFAAQDIRLKHLRKDTNGSAAVAVRTAVESSRTTPGSRGQASTGARSSPGVAAAAGSGPNGTRKRGGGTQRSLNEMWGPGARKGGAGPPKSGLSGSSDSESTLQGRRTGRDAKVGPNPEGGGALE